MIQSELRQVAPPTPGDSLFRPGPAALDRRPVAAGLLDGERWFVVQTLSNREAGAGVQLARQGFHAFLPRVRKTVRHARKLRTVLAPVFPGYLFVALDVERDRWRSINGTFGVTRLITAHERPAPVPMGVVEALLAMLDGDAVMRFDDGLRVGHRVEVIAGPFAQAVGELQRLDSAGRVRVLLQIMGGQVLVLVERSALRPA